MFLDDLRFSDNKRRVVISIGIDDMVVPAAKTTLIDDARTEVLEIEKQRGISVSSSVMQFDYAGHTINQGHFKEIVRSGSEYLRDVQDPGDGCLELRLRR